MALFSATIFLCGCNQKPTDEAQTVIKFSSWGSRTEYDILKQVISDYEKANPDVKVEFIHVPENYFRKLHLLYASKTEPDVVFVNNIYAPLYIKAGLFEDFRISIAMYSFLAENSISSKIGTCTNSIAASSFRSFC